MQRVVGNVIEMKVCRGLGAFDECLNSGLGCRPRRSATGPSLEFVEALRKS